MSKLVEAEMDGAAAAKQVMALKDTIGKLKSVSGRQSRPAQGWAHSKHPRRPLETQSPSKTA